MLVFYDKMLFLALSTDKKPMPPINHTSYETSMLKSLSPLPVPKRHVRAGKEMINSEQHSCTEHRRSMTELINIIDT